MQATRLSIDGKKQWLMALLFVIFGLALQTTPVQAASSGLSVQAEPAASQRDTGVSYFDLLLAPGKSETLKVKLANNGTEALKVNVRAVTATTSDAGGIDYTGSANQSDASLPARMSALVQGPKQVTVPAKGSAVYTATLTMPKQSIAGVLVGGLVFAPQGQASAASSGKMGIVNKYQYAIALLTRNSGTILTPKLAVDGIQAGRVKQVNRISATVRNQTAAFANHAAIQTTVTKPNGKQQTARLADAQLAPNSVMHQRLALGTDVAAGKYRVQTTVYWQKADDGKYADGHGNHYRAKTTATKTVTITAAKAKQLTKKAATGRAGMPTLYKALIAAAVVLVLVIIALVVVFFRRRRRDAAKLAALQAQVNELKDKH